ncbi:MAG TPA: maleylpyruvate isomerase N-terminal domain-containing protein [Chloroflexia bacterium]|nr:maleylpyruvate isomerase N-terminal domain-containing protein [Chloroflexia bacterium]
MWAGDLRTLPLVLVPMSGDGVRAVIQQMARSSTDIEAGQYVVGFLGGAGRGAAPGDHAPAAGTGWNPGRGLAVLAGSRLTGHAAGCYHAAPSRIQGAKTLPPTLTREEALAAFDAARREHQAFLAAIPRERMTEPGATGPWSVKDVIAHVAAWRGWTVARLEATAARRPEPPPPWPSGLNQDDPINAWFREQHRDEPLDAVLAGWDASFDRLRAACVSLPDEALFDPAYFPWMEGTALIEGLPGGFLGHFREEHEPALRAWLADGA